MNYLAWTAATGGLLLLMSLSYGWINRTPVPIFGVYLLVGVVCGPWGFDVLRLDVLQHSTLVSRITEIAIATSLFITGLKIRLPLRASIWKIGFRLAMPGMILTVLGVMVIAHYLTGLSWPISLALAAIIAPTDPVLASLIAINDARDDDSLRLSLSSEAGLNDGTALPLLMLALLWHNADGALSTEKWLHWLAVDVVWALVVGLAIGYGLGRLIGLIATRFRHSQGDVAPSDFIALALICLSFSLAMAVDASGFLAAFAAGVGLRSAELRVQQKNPVAEEQEENPPAEMMVNPHLRHAIEKRSPLKSVGLVIGDALSFGDTIERLLAAAIVIVLGITLAQHWDAMGLILAFILFFIIRPLAVYISTWKSSYSRQQRLLFGWLGIRGIGSLNYIAYAYMHGMQGADAEVMTNCALTIITASVLIHGITVTPLLNFWSKK
ncbi:sodium:proton antiporter [Rouxiella sp. S1S-2]|uniref:cation:proton antiporter n=1 Tax=Rouxiella sp. S1S-2 TaxID=2653856 RepID=UPI0012642589|nr:cation:proton antiporter [Rouxiella sp. S1S-2]KAB7897224.1 sodium:proton antiporter [Rouxiella sp. S1S-2]